LWGSLEGRVKGEFSPPIPHNTVTRFRRLNQGMIYPRSKEESNVGEKKTFWGPGLATFFLQKNITPREGEGRELRSKAFGIKNNGGVGPVTQKKSKTWSPCPGEKNFRGGWVGDTNLKFKTRRRSTIQENSRNNPHTRYYEISCHKI